MHSTFSSVGDLAICSGRLVDQSLLDNGAVHRETVRGRCRRSGRGRGGDEGLEDGVLRQVRPLYLGI